jgi:hypothetical protein
VGAAGGEGVGVELDAAAAGVGAWDAVDGPGDASGGGDVGEGDGGLLAEHVGEALEGGGGVGDFALDGKCATGTRRPGGDGDRVVAGERLPGSSKRTVYWTRRRSAMRV